MLSLEPYPMQVILHENVSSGTARTSASTNTSIMHVFVLSVEHRYVVGKTRGATIASVTTSPVMLDLHLFMRWYNS
jgi:hypothetical protein